MKKKTVNVNHSNSHIFLAFARAGRQTIDKVIVESIPKGCISDFIKYMRLRFLNKDVCFEFFARGYLYDDKKKLDMCEKEFNTYWKRWKKLL